MFLEFLRERIMQSDVTLPVYLDLIPPQPDDIMLVRSMQGRKPDQGHKYDRPGFQLLCRAKTHNIARGELFKAYKTLHDAPNMSDTFVVDIYAMQSPYFAGQDDLGRYIYVQNYQSEIVRE